jgi:hypothetical protein
VHERFRRVPLPSSLVPSKHLDDPHGAGLCAKVECAPLVGLFRLIPKAGDQPESSTLILLAKRCYELR